MKAISLNVMAAILISLVIGACKQSDDTVTPKITITEDEIADMLGTALADSTGGLASQLKVAGFVADSGRFPSMNIRELMGDSAPIETTMTKDWSFGLLSYHYTVTYIYTFSLLKDSLNFQYSMNGLFNTPRMSANDSTTSVLMITHILDTANPLKVNGTYNRIGSYASKIGEKKRFTSHVVIVLNNVTLNKATNLIAGGTLNITVSGESSDGTSFTYSGVLTFFGNRHSSLILNNITYFIDLGDGEVTRIDSP